MGGDWCGILGCIACFLILLITILGIFSSVSILVRKIPLLPITAMTARCVETTNGADGISAVDAEALFEVPTSFSAILVFLCCVGRKASSRGELYNGGRETTAVTGSSAKIGRKRNGLLCKTKQDAAKRQGLRFVSRAVFLPRFTWRARLLQTLPHRHHHHHHYHRIIAPIANSNTRNALRRAKPCHPLLVVICVFFISVS